MRNGLGSGRLRRRLRTSPNFCAVIYVTLNAYNTRQLNGRSHIMSALGADIVSCFLSSEHVEIFKIIK